MLLVRCCISFSYLENISKYFCARFLFGKHFYASFICFVLTYVWWVFIFIFIYLCFSQVVNFLCCFLYTEHSGGRGWANINFFHKLFCLIFLFFSYLSLFSFFSLLLFSVVFVCVFFLTFLWQSCEWSFLFLIFLWPPQMGEGGKAAAGFSVPVFVNLCLTLLGSQACSSLLSKTKARPG